MRRAAPRRRTLLKGLLGQKQLSQSQLVKKALVKMARREVLSAAQAEAVTASLKRAALRGVVLKLALPRRAPLKAAAPVNPVMLSAVRDSRQLAPLKLAPLRAALAKATLARRVALRAAPVNLAPVRPAPLRAAVDRAAAPKPVTLHTPALLALPGAALLVASGKIRVNRRKVPQIAGLMRLGPAPRARNHRRPSGVVPPSLAPRSRRASQWIRRLKPP